MSSAGYFERLAASVERIARHAYYPGIDQTISQCLEDIDELRTVGRITAEECEALRFVLLGVAISTSAKPAASNAASAA